MPHDLEISLFGELRVVAHGAGCEAEGVVAIAGGDAAREASPAGVGRGEGT